MKKKHFLLSLIIVLFLIIVFIISPHNLFHCFNGEKKVANILLDPETQLQISDDDSEVTNVKYLGTNIYQVETKENLFLIEIKSKKSMNVIDVFEHKNHVKQFKH